MGPSQALRAEIVRVCRRLYERGLIAGFDGNVSVRTDAGTLLVTPARVAKVDLNEEQVVETELDGRVIGGGKPSSELAMHLSIYRANTAANAVVHAHPPCATALSLADQGLPSDLLSEVAIMLGVVPVLPYRRPGSPELAFDAGECARSHHAFIMANHGATAVGGSLGEAHARMETLEHAARTMILGRILGSTRRIPASEAAALLSLAAKA